MSSSPDASLLNLRKLAWNEVASPFFFFGRTGARGRGGGRGRDGGGLDEGQGEDYNYD